MATMTTTSAMMNTPFRQLRREYNLIAFRSPPLSARFCHDSACSSIIEKGCHWSCCKGNLRSLVSPVCAIGSGLEASIAEPKENSIYVKNAEVVVESQDDGKIQVRADVNEEDTRVVFDKVLTDLARKAPPVRGFRKRKGGKTSKIPKDFLLQIFGEKEVVNFIIQEIVSSTVVNYIEKEKLKVKENKIYTVETAEELRSSFKPGNEFGFSVIFELEETTTETTSTSTALAES